jgi:hypothetical protein
MRARDDDRYKRGQPNLFDIDLPAAQAEIGSEQPLSGVTGDMRQRLTRSGAAVN